MENYNHERVGPDLFVWRVRVRSASHLDYWVNDYFSGLILIHENDGSSVITGELPDMPAVYGFILQLRDSGITLISLQVVKIPAGSS